MSTPQGPDRPYGGAGGQPPSDQPPTWGQQPPGGWGQPGGQWPADPGQRPWGQQAPPAWQRQGWAGPPPQQPYPPRPDAPGRPGWDQQPVPPYPQYQHPQHPLGQQWDPAFFEPPARRSSARAWVVAAGVAVVLGAVGVLGFVAPGVFVSRVFDSAAVQTGVQRVLTDDFAIPGVGPVSCGEDLEVAAGTAFECAAVIDGETLTVPVRVLSDEGDYQVGRPF